MVKRRKSSDSWESCPQFFKVYLPNQSSHRLGIPPEFVKYFTGVFPHKSTITSPGKISWHVELKEIDGHLYFQEGWQKFVQDNSLDFGDFLIFYYDCNAQFHVKIYGKNGCQKEVSGPIREIDREITLPQDKQTVELRKSKRLAQESNNEEVAQKELCPRFSKVIQEGNRAHKEASKVVSKFPSFKVVMNPTYINAGYMSIPSSFHGNIGKDRHGVKLVVSDRSWDVRFVKVGRKIWRFNRGWSTFCGENTLKVGDACVFELTEKNDFVLKVSVFRCLD